MSQREAARRFGVPRSTLQGHLARSDGYRVCGTSTLRDGNGNVKLEWVKTSEDTERREELFRLAASALASKLPAQSPIRAPNSTHSDLMTVYPVGDHHFGMLAWGRETGSEDYDLDRAEALLCGAIDHLVDASPASERAAILLLGDLMHYDGMIPVTPEHGNMLDADSRFPKMVRAALRSVRYLVCAALRKHNHVTLIVEIGNHDPSSAIFLMECFNALYENEPRIHVDDSPRPFHCLTFGLNMIGTHHGHKVKPDKLPLLFATDWPVEWGATKYRVIHSGHIHQDWVKEHSGCVVETHRILPPPDAYAAHGGWRSQRSMKSIVYHREHGEVARHTVNPGMLA